MARQLARSISPLDELELEVLDVEELELEVLELEELELEELVLDVEELELEVLELDELVLDVEELEEEVGGSPRFFLSPLHAATTITTNTIVEYPTNLRTVIPTAYILLC